MERSHFYNGKENNKYNRQLSIKQIEDWAVYM